MNVYLEDYRKLKVKAVYCRIGLLYNSRVLNSLNVITKDYKRAHWEMSINRKRSL